MWGEPVAWTLPLRAEHWVSAPRGSGRGFFLPHQTFAAPSSSLCRDSLHLAPTAWEPWPFSSVDLYQALQASPWTRGLTLTPACWVQSLLFHHAWTLPACLGSPASYPSLLWSLTAK